MGNSRSKSTCGFWKPVSLDDAKISTFAETLERQIAYSHQVVEDIFQELFDLEREQFQNVQKGKDLDLSLTLGLLPRDLVQLTKKYVGPPLMSFESFALVIYFLTTYSGDILATHYEGIKIHCTKQNWKISRNGIPLVEFKEWIQNQCTRRQLFCIVHAFGYNERLEKIWKPNLRAHVHQIQNFVLKESRQRILTMILGFVLERRLEEARMGQNHFLVVISNEYLSVQSYEGKDLVTLKNESVFWWIQPCEKEHVALLIKTLSQYNLNLLLIKLQKMDTGKNCVYMSIKNDS